MNELTTDLQVGINWKIITTIYLIAFIIAAILVVVIGIISTITIIGMVGLFIYLMARLNICAMIASQGKNPWDKSSQNNKPENRNDIFISRMSYDDLPKRGHHEKMRNYNNSKPRQENCNNRTKSNGRDRNK